MVNYKTKSWLSDKTTTEYKVHEFIIDYRTKDPAISKIIADSVAQVMDFHSTIGTANIRYIDIVIYKVNETTQEDEYMYDVTIEDKGVEKERGEADGG